MSPKVKPADAVAAARRAALDRGLEVRSNLDEEDSVELVNRAMATNLTDPSSGPSPYQPDSPHSFLDVLWASGHEALRGAAPPPVLGSVPAAQQRLSVMRGLQRPQEARDLSSTATAGGGFGASSALPSYLADHFSVSVKAAGVLAPRLEQEPLPDRGMTITAGKMTTSASTTVMASEGASVAEQDPTTATLTTPVATISGQLDVSQQLLSQSGPSFDVIAARELATLFAEDLDVQVINGSGSGGQLLGLLNTVSPTAVTSTTVTAVANIATIAKTYDLVSVAVGQAPDTTVLHPRRAGYIRGTLGYAPVPWQPGELIEAPAVPTTLTTNRDAILMFPRSEVLLLTSDLSVSVLPEVGSTNLTARISVYGYCALLVKTAAAIGVITGAGCAIPSYSV